MAKPNRSVRVSEPQDDFIDRTDLPLGEFTRDNLELERIRQAAGVCAVCGTVIYIEENGFATYRHSSAGGKQLNLPYGTEIDLCATHADSLMDAFEAEMDADIPEADVPAYPTLEYVNDVYDGDVAAYMLEQRAVMDASPGSAYSGIVNVRDEWERNPNLGRRFYLSRLIEHIADWLADDDAVRNDGTDTFDPVTVFHETDAFPQMLREDHSGNAPTPQ